MKKKIIAINFLDMRQGSVTSDGTKQGGQVKVEGRLRRSEDSPHEVNLGNTP